MSKAAEARRGSRREGQEASPLPRRVSLDSLPTLADVQNQRRKAEKPQPRVLDKIATRYDREKKAAAFRQAVWLRAAGKCEACGKPCKRTLELLPDQGHVHHRRGRNVAPADRFNPDAAELLCALCHRAHHDGKRR